MPLVNHTYKSLAFVVSTFLCIGMEDLTRQPLLNQGDTKEVLGGCGTR